MAKTFLLGVGAQKAGTTWLHRYLFDHPDVAMSRIKEMHFFNEIFLNEGDIPRKLAEGHFHKLLEILGEGRALWPLFAERSKDWIDRCALDGRIPAYFEYFEARRAGRKVAGEITPGYSLLRAEHYHEIRQHHDDIRPIFVMREPVERAWSSIRMAARNEKKPPEALVERMLTRPRQVERGRYDLTVAALREAFGAEGALILFYEELFTEAGVRRLCAFLDIAYRPADFDQRFNAAPESTPCPPEIEAQIVAAHRPVYDFVQAEGFALPQSWRARMAAHAL